MQIARTASPHRPASVVRLDDFRPKITASQLIEEALLLRTGPGPANLEESVALLPDLFVQTLCLILEDFDYRNNKKSNIAIACRLLAGSYVHFEERLQEVAQP